MASVESQPQAITLHLSLNELSLSITSGNPVVRISDGISFFSSSTLATREEESCELRDKLKRGRDFQLAYMKRKARMSLYDEQRYQITITRRINKDLSCIRVLTVARRNSVTDKNNFAISVTNSNSCAFNRVVALQTKVFLICFIMHYAVSFSISKVKCRLIIKSCAALNFHNLRRVHNKINL